jgi:hypothetical protein
MNPSISMKLIEAVQEQVRANGAVLTFLQFSLVAIVALGLAYAGMARGQRFPTMAGLGISANAFVVCLFGWRAIRTRKSPAGLLETARREQRWRKATVVGNRDRQTLTVLVTMLAPFALAVIITVQLLSKPR